MKNFVTATIDEIYGLATKADITHRNKVPKHRTNEAYSIKNKVKSNLIKRGTEK